MNERQQLEKTIAELEEQRGVLSDDAVDASISALRKQLANLETPEQQRKLVTILFADIVGSTEIIRDLDPEENLEIIDGALKRLAVPVEAHNGHVTRFMGDGFKAVFGAPVAHENDAEMAIRAGLGILEVAQEYAKEMGERWGIQDFQVRVGVNTGLVALGGMTEAEDTLMGSMVNLATRIESAAPPGSLLISHDTYRHVRGVFDVEGQEPIEAKGFDEPVPVYLVLRAKSRAFRTRTRGVEGVETRMVGRKAEFIALQEIYKTAVDGKQTQVVTVVGEAGVGKSRLLYEFQNWIELLPDVIRFFQGRGRQETQNLPYGLLRDLFSTHFQIQENDSAAEMRAKVDAGFGEVLGGDEAGQMRAHITGQLLGFDFSQSLHLKNILDDPQQMRDRALMYLAEYFKAVSDQAPTVIFLEDVHWADDSSLDMVNQLARRLPGQRLLIVPLARHRLFDRRPYWGEGLAYHRRLELEPLSRLESGKLVAEILQKVERVPESLRELVVKGAEGNPFYIEELVKMLVEDGVILTGEESWRVEPGRLAEVDVPATLTGVLQARLDGLPAGEREILQQASVVGRIFWDETVEYMTTETQTHHTPPAIRHSSSAILNTGERLSSLRQRELIYRREESAFTSAGEYIFKHAVLRDVTYESVLKRVRRAYHGLVAEWLIAHSGERAGEYTGLIADHLELAGKSEQAAIYLYQAGELAAGRYAQSEAVEYFSRALAVTPDDDLAGRYDILLARECVLATQGERMAQQSDLTTLKEIAEAIDDLRKQAKVALLQMIYYSDVGDFPSINEMVGEALRLAQAAGDVECEADIYHRWGMSLWLQGKPAAARSPLEQALTIAQSHQLHQVEVDSLRNLGTVFSLLLDGTRSTALYEQALDKYRQIGDRWGEAFCLNNLGVHYALYEINLSKAKDYYEQALLIHQEIGNRWGEGIASHNLGGTARQQGDYGAAVTWQIQSLDIRCVIGDRVGESGSYLYLATCHFDLGEYEQATKYINLSMSITPEIGDLDGEVSGLLAWLDFHRAMGDYKSAQAYSKQLKVKWNEVEAPGNKAEILFHFSLLKHHLGDNQAAQEYANQGLRFLGDFEKHRLKWYGLTYSGHALTALGRQEEAEEAYQNAINIGNETQKSRQAIEAQAGLARVYMARGDIEQALTQVEEILTYMDANTPPKGSKHCLDGTIEPLRIYLTCYQVLKANNDPRATKILTDAYNLLQTRAGNISDEELRGSYLNNVVANREIVREFEKSGFGGL